MNALPFAEGLERGFSSLNALREACEAFMARPGLKKLPTEVGAGA